MDFAYLVVAALLWLAIFGLAHGCKRLQSRGVKS
jgi:hypothetical protein